MFPGSTKAGGQAMGTPDVCKTPSPGGPVPVPYPNIAMVAQASKTSTKVKFGGKAVVTTKSEVPRSMGDEAGTVGGVISNVNMNKVTFKKGSSKVKIQGQPCVYHTAMTAHNGANANFPAGSQLAPSQTKVLVAF
jgi:uncharacterized Zn-binding protein involved in type VI secretion